ncbi:hypothetical protein L484_023839 [Morus notabilis]|uniref:NLE domain-containing protein n=1 Tax=Morus notabilis TaxID=981085 RepID=W9R5A4_9ROSA|nr:hypothetical protein L484_023839 [Morus notabilis]
MLELGMEVESVGKSVMCLLEDPQGNPLDSPMFLPLTFGPEHLLQVVNQLLNNEEKLPYAFYVSDKELIVPLGVYLEKNKVSVEKVLSIVYQPQAVFRVRPVYRCSATIAGSLFYSLLLLYFPASTNLYYSD